MFEPGVIQNAAAVGAAFSASLVECVEALTIVLAVGSVSGWRSSLLGVASGALLLSVTVALAGSTLVRVAFVAAESSIENSRHEGAAGRSRDIQ